MKGKEKRPPENLVEDSTVRFGHVKIMLEPFGWLFFCHADNFFKVMPLAKSEPRTRCIVNYIINLTTTCLEVFTAMLL